MTAAQDVVELGGYGPVTRTDLVRYAGAGGDFNPIHHDDDFARGAGYPSVFAHGLLTAGILASRVTARFGADRLRRFSVRYRDQVWPGDTLTCTAQADPDAADAGGEQYRLQVHARRADGREALVLTGTALIGPGAVSQA